MSATMTNNTPDYNDNLYFEEKKMDCKNCPYTDEYCASGDCKRDNDLTEQWHDKNLDIWIYYYVEYTECDEQYIAPAKLHQNNLFYFAGNENGYGLEEIDKVLAPVPSYEEWMNAQKEIQKKAYELGNLGYKIKNQRHEIDNRLKEIEKLKELLQQAEKQIIVYKNNDTLPERAFYEKEVEELLTKIDEVLK